MIQTALKYDTEVLEDGRVDFRVPLPSGSRITVFVVTENALETDDLVGVAESSLEFWNNPLDDEDWNNA